MSDQALAGALAGAGAPIARRTVAKYREMLGIPAAHARRRRG
jgi:RNA polymerase sigma-54 factor